MQLGIGAMLHYLKGGSEHSAEEYLGKKISSASLEDDRFKITFEDGKKIEIWDDCQSCCEHRYVMTDDDPKRLIGKTLNRIEAKAGPDQKGEYDDEHETCFVEIGTLEGEWVTLVAHNEHNGYYGGFGLTITEPSE